MMSRSGRLAHPAALVAVLVPVVPSLARAERPEGVCVQVSVDFTPAILLESGNALSLTKANSGTLTLSATNTYSGATTVSAGTLSITGSANNSAVTVQSGATLAGGGSSGPVTVNGGTHSPGTSPGTYTVNGNYVENGVLTIEFLNATGGPGSGYDQVDIAGSGTFSNNNASLRLTLGAFAPASGDKFTIVKVDGTDSAKRMGTFGSFNGVITSMTQGATIVDPDTGQTFRISYRAEGNTFDAGAGNGNDIMLEAISPVGGAVLTWRGDAGPNWDITTTANWRTTGGTASVGEGGLGSAGGPADAGSEAPRGSESDGGCGCAVPGRQRSSSAGLISLLALSWLAARRARRRA